MWGWGMWLMWGQLVPARVPPEDLVLRFVYSWKISWGGWRSRGRWKVRTVVCHSCLFCPDQISQGNRAIILSFLCDRLPRASLLLRSLFMTAVWDRRFCEYLRRPDIPAIQFKNTFIHKLRRFSSWCKGFILVGSFLIPTDLMRIEDWWHSAFLAGAATLKADDSLACPA